MITAFLKKKYFKKFQEWIGSVWQERDPVMFRFNVYKKGENIIMEVSSESYVFPFAMAKGAAEHLGKDLMCIADPQEELLIE